MFIDLKSSTFKDSFKYFTELIPLLQYGVSAWNRHLCLEIKPICNKSVMCALHFETIFHPLDHINDNFLVN